MPRLASLATGCLILVSVAVSAPVAQQRPELSSANVDDIATLLKLEDTRQFDAPALGRIPAPEARTALTTYLAAAPIAADAAVVGEALLSWGRFTGAADIAPVLRWIASPNVDVRWRATWALFRPRDPAAVPHLMKL